MRDPCSIARSSASTALSPHSRRAAKPAAGYVEDDCSDQAQRPGCGPLRIFTETVSVSSASPPGLRRFFLPSLRESFVLLATRSQVQ